MQKKPTIHDIAKALKISAATVSMVMNGRASDMRISQKLQDRVKGYLGEIGFQPNMIAQSLRTGKTYTIGVMVEDIADPFFSAISRQIEIVAYRYGYKLFFSSTENNTEKTRALIQVFRDRQVDGYIMAPPPGIEAEVQRLLDDKLPVVLFDRYFKQLATHNITVDNFGGARDVVKHLALRPGINIGFITLESDQTQMAGRLEGFLNTCAELQLQPFVEKIPYRMDEAGTVARILRFLQQELQLHAVLFGTNYLAIAGLKAIARLGLMIPSDLAVAGFDDNSHFELFTPSITAVAQPVHGIAEQVIEKLINLMITTDASPPETLKLPVELIVRESSRNQFIKASPVTNRPD